MDDTDRRISDIKDAWSNQQNMDPVLLDRFMNAASCGDTETVKSILEDSKNSGIQVDSVMFQCATPRTALELANEGDELELVEYLIEAGADVNRKGLTSGRTPLMVAAETDTRFLILKELVEAGAEINALFRANGVTAFMVACEKHNQFAIEYLAREAKADTSILTTEKMTPLHIFLKGTSSIHPDFRQYNTWKNSVGTNSVYCLRLLLEIIDKEMVNVQNTAGLTPLFYAAMTGSATYTELLIQAGADVNVRDDKDLQIIHYASNEEVVRVLAKAGADLSLQNKTLHRAVEKVQIKKAAVLLELGEKMDEATGRLLVKLLMDTHFEESHIPRHEISKMLRLLEEFGAPLDGYPDMKEDIECLLAYNPKDADIIQFFEAVSMGEVGEIRRILRDKASYDIPVNIRSLSEDKLTALHVAACRNFSALQYLLQNESPSLEMKTESGLTALHCACWYGNLAHVKCLIEAGAEKEAKTRSGTTPLLLAAERRHFDVMEFLLQNGADSSASEDASGYNWIHKVIVGRNLNQSDDEDDEENWGNDSEEEADEETDEDQIDIEDDEENGGNESEEEADEETDEDLDRTLETCLASLLPIYGKEIINNPCSDGGWCVLHLACLNFPIVNKNVIRLLIQNGSKIDSSTVSLQYGKDYVSGNTPLHVTEHSELADFLVKECGANINATNEMGRPPIHHYLTNHDIDSADLPMLIESLCSSGAQINIQDKNGDTAIHIALRLGVPPDCIRSLLRAGSLLTIPRNIDSVTPLHLLFSFPAEWWDTANLPRLLDQATPDDDTPNGIFERRKSILELVLDHSLAHCINIMSLRDMKGRTPLTWFLQLALAVWFTDDVEVALTDDDLEDAGDLDTVLAKAKKRIHEKQDVVRKNIHLWLAKLLKMTGPDINDQAHNNENALILAASNYSHAQDPDLWLGIIFDLLKHQVGATGSVDGRASVSRGMQSSESGPRKSKKRRFGASPLSHNMLTLIVVISTTLQLLIQPASALLMTTKGSSCHTYQSQLVNQERKFNPPNLSRKSQEDFLFEDMSSMFQTRMAPIPDMPSQLFQELASSQLEFLAKSLTSNQRPGSSKVKSMALYLPQENVVTGQLEFTPVVLYPRRDRVFIAPEADSGVAPTLPPTLTKLPGFSHAKSLIPGYPMVSTGSDSSNSPLEDDGSIGVVEEVLCDLQSNGACALSVPLFSGIQTVGVLLVSPADVPVDDPFESVWTTEDRQQVARAARSLSLALNMEQQNQAVVAEKQQIAEALSDSMHQVKNPLQALRTYGKMLQQQIAQSDIDNDYSDKPSYLKSPAYASQRRLLELADHLMVQSERLTKRLEPVDFMVEQLSAPIERPALLPAGSSALVAKSDTDNSSSKKAKPISSSLIPMPYPLEPWEASTDSAVKKVASSKASESSASRSIVYTESPETNESVSHKTSVTQSTVQFSTPILAEEALEMAFVPDVLESTLDAFATIAQDRNIGFSVIQDDELPGVTIHPTSLDEVVGNVLDNALKYVNVGKGEIPNNNPSPQVLVYILPNDDEVDEPGVTIVVSDNGPGIPAGDEESIFNRGYRVDETQERAPGQGLGLPIARTLMDAMGGKIRVFEKSSKRNDQVYRALKSKLLDGTTMEIVIYRRRL